MTDEERMARGREVVDLVHGGVVSTTGGGDMGGIVLRNIYNDIWGREVMPIRDRRLMVLGALATMSLTPVFETHLRSAIALKELTWEEIDEIPIALSPYIGMPRTTYIMRLIGTLKAELKGSAG
jgi:4-carboxymuconolactone decarboxylase